MLIMEHVKKFLENSTIHGLVWISRTRRFDKVFWLLVVLGGFLTAIALIRASFYNWEQRPTITTLETLPISKITYPNVTVCPPKYSFLNLNFDIFRCVSISITRCVRMSHVFVSQNCIKYVILKIFSISGKPGG